MINDGGMKNKKVKDEGRQESPVLPASSRRETGGVGGAGMEEVSRGGGMGENDMALENDMMFMGGGGGVEEAGGRGRGAVRPTERTCMWLEGGGGGGAKRWGNLRGAHTRDCRRRV